MPSLEYVEIDLAREEGLEAVALLLSGHHRTAGELEGPAVTHVRLEDPDGPNQPLGALLEEIRDFERRDLELSQVGPRFVQKPRSPAGRTRGQVAEWLEERQKLAAKQGRSPHELPLAEEARRERAWLHRQGG